MKTNEGIDAKLFFDEFIMEGDKVKLTLDHKNKTAMVVLRRADEDMEDVVVPNASYQDVMGTLEELGRKS